MPAQISRTHHAGANRLQSASDWKICCVYRPGCQVYDWLDLICCTRSQYSASYVSWQGGHKPGKPWILADYSEHGKLVEFSGNPVQPQGKLILTLRSGCSLSSNPYAAKCIWCTKTVDLSSMGWQALVSHMSSSWCGMTLGIWRSLLRILLVAITSGKV